MILRESLDTHGDVEIRLLTAGNHGQTRRASPIIFPSTIWQPLHPTFISLFVNIAQWLIADFQLLAYYCMIWFWQQRQVELCGKRTLDPSSNANCGFDDPHITGSCENITEASSQPCRCISLVSICRWIPYIVNCDTTHFGAPTVEPLSCQLSPPPFFATVNFQ